MIVWPPWSCGRQISAAKAVEAKTVDARNTKALEKCISEKYCRNNLHLQKLIYIPTLKNLAVANPE